MVLQPINFGAAANDRTGDSLREAMRKTQQNFEYLDQGKVDKVAGMGLSSNNFTNDERVKLANIQAAATKNLADAVLLERSNHTGGFNGFGTAYLMRNHDALPLTAPPSAYFGKGSFVGFAMGVEVGIPDLSYGIGRVDAHWGDASGDYGVMRSFEGWGSRKFTSFALDANTWSPWLEITNRANLQGTQPLSTISDAGTAAARNVQTSQIDVTAGRLMPVGAFGLGKPNVVGNMDLNVIAQYPTGVSHYYVNNASNGPYVAFYGYLTVERIDDVYMIQTCKAVGEGTSFKRVTNNGVKGPWDKLIDTTSAVGAIASGSIVERGSNANGEYVKFADGTMICTHKIAGISPSNASSVGNIYRSNSTLWTFPAVFAVQPSVSHGESSGLGLCWTSLGSTGITTSNTSVALYSMAQGGSAVVCFTAVGRWK